MADTLYDLSQRDVFDSRDAIERIEELTEQLDDETFEWCDEDEKIEAQDELDALNALADEAGEEWSHGMTFVADSYFEDYAQELAEDCGCIDRDAAWPATCIDWADAARQLQMDYTPFTVDCVDFWARS